MACIFFTGNALATKKRELTEDEKNFQLQGKLLDQKYNSNCLSFFIPFFKAKYPFEHIFIENEKNEENKENEERDILVLISSGNYTIGGCTLLPGDKKNFSLLKENEHTIYLLYKENSEDEHYYALRSYKTSFSEELDASKINPAKHAIVVTREDFEQGHQKVLLESTLNGRTWELTHKMTFISDDDDNKTIIIKS